MHFFKIQAAKVKPAGRSMPVNGAQAGAVSVRGSSLVGLQVLVLPWRPRDGTTTRRDEPLPNRRPIR